jgi:hypothetical protein
MVPRVIRETRGEGRRKHRLWHLLTAVLVAALVFGAIRAVASETNSLVLDALFFVGTLVVFFVSVTIVAGVPIVFFHFGVKLGDRVARRLKSWGLRRGGGFGSCARRVGIGANFAIVAGAIVLGPAFVMSAMFLLAYLAGV